MRLRIAHALTRGAVVALVWTAATTVSFAGQEAAVRLQGTSPAGAADAATGRDPFGRRGWHVELSGGAALEAWNYNISQEEMGGPYAGLAYGVGRGVTIVAGWPLYYVSQRGVNGWMFGATFGVRSRFARIRQASLYWEFEVGISEADTPVPPRGTRFNFLAQGSAGAAVRVTSGLHLLTSIEWIHVSNGGLPAGRGRNPDIEAVGLRTGLLIGF